MYKGAVCWAYSTSQTTNMTFTVDLGNKYLQPLVRHTHMFVSFVWNSKHSPPANLEMRASVFLAFPEIVFGALRFNFIRSEGNTKHCN